MAVDITRITWIDQAKDYARASYGVAQKRCPQAGSMYLEVVKMANAYIQQGLNRSGTFVETERVKELVSLVQAADAHWKTLLAAKTPKCQPAQVASVPTPATQPGGKIVAPGAPGTQAPPVVITPTGGLPWWVWGLIIVGGGYAFYHLSKKGK